MRQQMGIISDFSEALSAGRQLVLMPVSRLLVHEQLRFGGIVLYAPGEIELKALRPIPNRTLENAPSDGETTILQGQVHREVCTSLTGFSLDVLDRSPLIAFPYDVGWDSFCSGDHDFDRTLVRRLIAHSEPVMDIVRFDFCRFDLPDTLPGRIGSWDESGPYCGALIYNPSDHESYLIAASAVVSSIVVAGIGLELDFAPSTPIPAKQDGEVASIAAQALTLFRDVMEASSDTNKFMRAMVLLEFLAEPDSFSKWQEAKKQIACHVAADQVHYARLLERFKELTGKRDNGVESGYRTLVVHHGRYIEDIIPDERDRRLLFRELQQYSSFVIGDMLERPTETWEQFLQFRQELKKKKGISF